MATITVTIPDQLITLYNAARASWNVYIAAQGGTLLPAPTKAALETVLKDIIKSHVLGEAVRTGKSGDEVDALRALLDGL